MLAPGSFQAWAFCRCEGTGPQDPGSVVVSWADGPDLATVGLAGVGWCVPVRRLSLEARMYALVSGQIAPARTPRRSDVALARLPVDGFGEWVAAAAELACCLAHRSWVMLSWQVESTRHLQAAELRDLAALVGPRSSLRLDAGLTAAALLW